MAQKGVTRVTPKTPFLSLFYVFEKALICRLMHIFVPYHFFTVLHFLTLFSLFLTYFG